MEACFLYYNLVFVLVNGSSVIHFIVNNCIIIEICTSYYKRKVGLVHYWVCVGVLAGLSIYNLFCSEFSSKY